MLVREARTTDDAYRYGGEELAVLARDSDLAAATVLADRLCAAIAEADLTHPAAGGVTASLGVAQLAPGGDPGDVVAAADAALYRAKAGGRNRVEVASARPGLTAVGDVGT